MDRYWVGSRGKASGLMWVYDSELPHPDPKMVYLFSANAKRIDEHSKFLVKTRLKTVPAPLRDIAIVEYELWWSAVGSTLGEKDREPALIRMREREQALIQRHRDHLVKMGKEYKGSRIVEPTVHRTAKCWNCHEPLDNAADLECNSCGWIVCSCGACGCG